MKINTRNTLLLLGTIFGAVATAAMFSAFFGWLFWLLWGWIAVGVFEFPELTFIQAWGFLLLLGLVAMPFKSFKS